MGELRIFGPPGCLAANTVLNIRRGKRNSGRDITIEKAYYKFNNWKIPPCYGSNYPWRGEHDAMILSLQENVIKYHKIAKIVHSGYKTLYEITTVNNRSLSATLEHPFKTEEGFTQLRFLQPGSIVFCRNLNASPNGRQKNKKRRVIYCARYHPHAFKHNQAGVNYGRITYAKVVYEANMNNMSPVEFVRIVRHNKLQASQLKYLDKDIVLHHKDHNQLNDSFGNLEITTKNTHDKLHGYFNIKNFGYFEPQKDTVKSIKNIGKGLTFDIVMDTPYHNYVAQGFIVHNTGKSTRLATEEIPNAVRKYGTDKVVVTSFTRTGAKEIATKKSFLTGRTIPVEPQHVGTLHALCYRQLGQPELMEKHISKWNEAYPDFAISGKDLGSLDEGGSDINVDGTAGDKLFSQYNIYRAKMIDERYWGSKVQRFAALWTDFKKQLGAMDFADLIETALRDLPYAPGHPDVIFVDEAQDFTRLQLSLVRSWGQMAKWIVLVGDDDQTIYGFAGATPDAFLNPPIDDKFKRSLEQSYRVPQAVLDQAMKIITQVKVREKKTYKARKENGKTVQGIVRTHKDESYKKPNFVIDEAKEYISQGKTVMFLASCSYMLEPLKAVLRKEGLPFWNQYRIKRGDWNPLQAGKEKTTARDVVVNFLGSGIDGKYWDIHQFVSWAKYLKVQEGGLIRKQGKAGLKALKQAIEEGQKGLHTSENVISQLLTPAAIQPAMDRNIDWLLHNFLAAKVDPMQYPVHVYKQFGKSAIENVPQITIGTIHSVKGGESDIVFLYPDISYKAFKEIGQLGDAKRDELYRLFYVGMTRAREELVIMKYANQKGRPYYVDLIK